MLWITAFMPNEALIAPPQPPIANSSIDRITLLTSGSPQGRRRIQPNSPVPPRSAPAISSEAMIVKAVTKLGYRINSVLNVWNSFQPAHAGIHELVMEADRGREQDEHREDHPAERIAEQLAAGRGRQQRVPDDVRRQQPEVHERMAEPPEQHPRQDGSIVVDQPSDQGIS